MADSYTTVEPMTSAEFYLAAEEAGFAVDRRNGSMVHDDERGCYGITEEEGDDEETYVGCMRDPEIDQVEMVLTDQHPACCGDDDD